MCANLFRFGIENVRDLALSGVHLQRGFGVLSGIQSRNPKAPELFALVGVKQFVSLRQYKRRLRTKRSYALRIFAVLSVLFLSAPGVRAQNTLFNILLDSSTIDDPIAVRLFSAQVDSSAWSALQNGQQAPPTSSPGPVLAQDGSQVVQTKRLIGIVPNFSAVSADTYPPPLSLRKKFWLATQNTFDYSSFIFVGLQAAVEQAENTYPEFQQGATGYGRYYWHTFADQGVGNYFTGAIFPTITHEDPRYYTRFHGGFFRRTGYAMSRLVITRNDAGDHTFNFSEVLGLGAATEVSGLYYPVRERGGVDEFCERWATQLLMDGVSNIITEFWPDINHKFFHRHSN